MAKPADKSTEMEQFLEAVFGRTTAITNDRCVLCNGPATEFRDEASKEEYAISGMCQKCQDEVFGQ